jgi:arylsulfatase A-like enzyme
MAEDALVFEDAVAPGCWTTPVHASIFSGLSVCELGIDYYNRGFAAFDDTVLSLAEILRHAGYQTVAYPDHPFFYNGTPEISLVRGFDQFNVINDFQKYLSHTNVASPGGPSVMESQLGPFRFLAAEELERLVDAFNAGEIEPSAEADADLDPVSGIRFARLAPLFADSPYFDRRYRRELDAHVFTGEPERPYFLFLNLHMCNLALPDPELFQRWYLRTLMLNAREAGRTLGHGPEGAPVMERLQVMHRDLGRPHAPFPTPDLYMKQSFDNRFYDANFEAMWGYLEEKGRLENTITIVTSDHGLSFSEKGEALFLHGGARPHENIVRVPLVIRFPEGSPLRRLHGRRQELVSLTDLFTTTTDLALGPGVYTRDRPVRGRSLVRRIDDEDYEAAVVSECSMAPNSYAFLPGTACYAKALYSGRMKLIHGTRAFATTDDWPIRLRLEEEWPFPEARPPHVELDHPFTQLFDLESDPHEERDLALEDPEAVELLRRLESHWACDPRETPEAEPVWDEEALETLRALGYIQ